jgi:hypothetical protein
MSLDLLLTNARIVTEARVFEGWVGVAEGVSRRWGRATRRRLIG